MVAWSAARSRARQPSNRRLLQGDRSPKTKYFHSGRSETQADPESLNSFNRPRVKCLCLQQADGGGCRTLPGTLTDPGLPGFPGPDRGAHGESDPTRQGMTSNNTVQDYNTYIKQFPTNLIAGMFWVLEKGISRPLPVLIRPRILNSRWG